MSKFRTLQFVSSALNTGRRSSSGFSLVEIMAVLVISGVLIAVALPNFKDPLASTRVNGTANLLVGSLDTLRSEAMTKNVTVVMCRSSDPMAAVPVCDSLSTASTPGNDWATGWLIFAKDANTSPAAGAAATITPAPSAGSPYSAATDVLIQRVMPTAGQTLVGDRTRVVVNPPLGLIAIGPQGTRVGAAGIAPTFTVEYRSDSEAVNPGAARCVNVNLMGRPELVNMTGTTC